MNSITKTSNKPLDLNLQDTFTRSINYLRISLTDQCNLKCFYCTPEGWQQKLASNELLSYEELLRVAKLAVAMGIRKIRLTGGEPLVRRQVLYFIRKLGALAGLDDIRLTTNGILLDEFAAKLLAAGVKKINISLDSLQRRRYAEITGGDRFPEVWRGIELARDLGFSPIKINMVVLRGVNDDELLDFARLTLTQPYQVRFIEFMPIGVDSLWGTEKYISSVEIKKRVETIGVMLPVTSDKMEGPARVYRFEHAVGSLGFISPLSHHFCDKCNRLRLTAPGKLRSCLLSDEETDLKFFLRNGCTDDEIKQIIMATVKTKPKGHLLTEINRGSCHGQMSRIGG